MPQGVYEFLNDGMKFIMDNSNILQIQLINFTLNDASYDDDYEVAGSSVSYASGLIFPVGGKYGSYERILLEQGKIKNSDKKIYVFGNNSFNTSGLLIGIGSPVNEYYKTINDGIQTYEVNGSPVYKKLFLRYNNTGSIY